MGLGLPSPREGGASHLTARRLTRGESNRRPHERRYDHTAQYELIMSQMGDQKFSQLEGLASSAVRATVISGAKLIVLFSSTGQTSRIVAKYRPPVCIY